MRSWRGFRASSPDFESGQQWKSRARILSQSRAWMGPALDPVLLEHRDFIYREFLELPLTL